MEWVSLISVLVGAIIGLAGSLFSDRTRWQREATERAMTHRRTEYSKFLGSLSEARNEVRIAAHDDQLELPQRAIRAIDAFKQAGAYEARFRVALISSPSVRRASDGAFRALRGLRDVVARGATHGQQEYLDARAASDTAFDLLVVQMRADLGVNELP